MGSSGYVYFIGQATAGPVKIGASGEPRYRLMGLQTASPVPLVLLAVLRSADCRHDERELHRRFASVRLYGEWFERTPELLALIASAEVPLPTRKALKLRAAAGIREVQAVDLASPDALEKPITLRDASLALDRSLDALRKRVQRAETRPVGRQSGAYLFRLGDLV